MVREMPALTSCWAHLRNNGPTSFFVFVFFVFDKVRTAYRSLAAAHHPDRHVGGDQEKAEVEFKRVSGGKLQYAMVKTNKTVKGRFNGFVGGKVEVQCDQVRFIIHLFPSLKCTEE